MIMETATIICLPAYMTLLYDAIDDAIDIKRTIATIYKFHKNNKLAMFTGRNCYGDFPYEADDDRCDACAKALKKLGFTGGWAAGVTKICFPHRSNWVIKVPILKAWSPLLLSEVTLMNSAPRHLKLHFPETLVFERGRYMFQEKCRLPDAWKDISEDAKQAANSLGIYDLHYENFGLSNSGVWKIIDLQTPTSLKSVRRYRRGASVAA